MQSRQGIILIEDWLLGVGCAIVVLAKWSLAKRVSDSDPDPRIDPTTRGHASLYKRCDSPETAQQT